jgi:hypothetical protein
MVLSLQQLTLRLVPTHDMIESNLGHLLGFQNRFLKDLSSHPMEPIDDYFFSTLLDYGNTSFFWMMKFVNRQIHRLPINIAMLACWQEHYKTHRSLVVFSMRTHWDKVVMFVYTINNKQKNKIPNNLLDQKRSDRWTPEDWDFLCTLTLERLFYISSNYENM